MAEHRLNRAQIGAAFEEIGRKGVSKHMGRDTIHGDPGLDRVFANSSEEILSRHCGASARQERRVFAIGPTAEQRGPCAVEVPFERIGRDFTQRDDAFLSALADDAQEQGPSIDRRDGERNELCDPQTGAIEHFQHGDIAQSEWVLGIGSLDQRGRLVRAQDLGKGPRSFWGAETLERVCADASLFLGRANRELFGGAETD